ncbi:class A beta-lactamase [Cellulomonas sp. NPDC055163]
MHDGAHVWRTPTTTGARSGTPTAAARPARPAPAADAAARTPHPGPTRRTVLLAGLAGLAVPLAACTPGSPDAAATTTPSPTGTPAASSAQGAPAVDTAAVQAALAALETESGLTLGVAAIDTGTGAVVGHRADERVLLCSTAKVLVVAAALALRAERPALLGEPVPIPAGQVVDHSPVTAGHEGGELPVAVLCDAAITQSDNTAANALMTLVGGPAGATAYVRTLGDEVTRLDRLEPELNQGAPGDERDTSTPAQVAADLRLLAVEEGLPPESRDPLVGWMRGSTTGDDRIRAGAPEGWTVGDKTGTGPNGEVHDVGVLWPPSGAPLVLAVYTSPAVAGTGSVEASAAVIARVAALVTEAFAAA